MDWRTLSSYSARRSTGTLASHTISILGFFFPGFDGRRGIGAHGRGRHEDTVEHGYCRARAARPYDVRHHGGPFPRRGA
jgi:hypothetical protein